MNIFYELNTFGFSIFLSHDKDDKLFLYFHMGEDSRISSYLNYLNICSMEDSIYFEIMVLSCTRIYKKYSYFNIKSAMVVCYR
jgi:hypothetical protein